MQALVDDLEKEKDSIEALETHLSEQLLVVRSQERDSLEDLTLKTSNEVNRLQILQGAKKEHLKLLGEQIGSKTETFTIDSLIASIESSLEEDVEKGLMQSLKSLHASLPERAQSVRDKSRELAYSLQYALHLGHQMIEAIQGATSHPPMLIYTAVGSKKISASKRMMVNKVG